MTTQERSAELPAGQCFTRARPARHQGEQQALAVAAIVKLTLGSVLRLPSPVAQSLADALHFLLCGEESAVHAFGRR